MMSFIFLRTAWRNVFRNRRRSLIVISAVAVGVAGALFIILFSAGMMEQMVASVVRSIGHVRIQHPEYADNPNVNRLIHNSARIIEALEESEEVDRWSPRLMVRGLARSATTSAGVQIIGVDAETESQLTSVAERIIEGSYLTGRTSVRRKEIIIGLKLAEKLDIKVGRKMVLTTQGRVINGDAVSDETEVVSGAFRIVGIFRLPSDAMNEAMVFINLVDAQTLLNVGDDLSEVAVRLRDDETLVSTAAGLREKLSAEDYSVETWQDGNKSLVQMVDIFEKSIVIYVIIVFMGAAFGIVNTMLMAVFERMREFGILRAVGTGRWTLFRMVIYEALFICILGTLGGFAIIGLLHVLWMRHGLDMSVFAESLALFGSDVIIKPAFNTGMMVETVVTVLIMGTMSAVWPAIRAARLQPAETMRKG
jgi:putative ABC transport system permease protein